MLVKLTPVLLMLMACQDFVLWIGEGKEGKVRDLLNLEGGGK
jgi:hypothetical protein